MAGLWEPVSGVFWSAPPPVVVADEGLSVYWFIVSAVVVATVIVAGMWHNAKKAEPVKWNLRNHLGKVGSAMTYAYLVVIVAMIWGRSGQLLNMPLNEVGDFLAGAFGPVAFLWLVLGFLQQGDELRTSSKALELQATELKNSVEQQKVMAAAALEQIEAQRATLQMQIDERDEGLRANFSIDSGYASYGSGRVRNTIMIRNQGSDAANLAITFEPEIPGVDLRLADMRSEAQESYSFSYIADGSPRNGLATITYYDRGGLVRHQSFVYELDEATDTYGFRRYYEN